MTVTQEMIEQVGAWCFNSPELEPDRKKAWRDFFGEDDPRPIKYWTNADERISRERRFLGWFMLDYTLPTGEKPAELAARRLYTGSTQAEALQAFSRARYLLAVATGVGRRSVYLEVEDESFEVRYPAWVSHLSPNQAVVAHLVPAGHGYWLPAPGWFMWPISIGPGMRANLKAYQSDPVSTERSLQGRHDKEESKPRPPRDDTLEAAVARMSAWARRKGQARLAMPVEEWRALVQRHISDRDMQGFVDEVLRRVKGDATGEGPNIDEANEMLALATNIWNNTPQPNRGGMSPNQLVKLQTGSRKQTSGREGTSRKATSKATSRPKKRWVFDPDSGGTRIPDPVKRRTEQLLRRYAEEHFAGRYTRLDIRFRGQFCYVDAYTEPDDSPNWPPPGWPESREEYLERLRNTPTHLCRLRYFGREDHWGFAFYKYSDERYELSVFPSGEFFGRPEEAFHVSAQAYLR